MDEGRAILTVKSEFFHADNGLVASTDPGWKQLVFDTLTGIFDRVGLPKKRSQDRGGGVQVIPGSCVTGIQFLHTSYDRGGSEFQGETVRMGALSGVQYGTDKEFTRGALPNPAQSGKMGVWAGGQGGSRRQQSQDLQDGVSCKGRTYSLQSQRVQWPGIDADGDDSALMAPARQVHRGDTGGGQPPPPTVPSM